MSISAGHIKTAEAADSILRTGGNAVDAAIAAFLMTWVVEPCMSSAGGGGFAMVQMDGNTPMLLDFFCQTPLYKRGISELDFYPITVDFGDTREVFHVGLGSTGVPGAIHGMFELYNRFGSLPLAVLFEPAIEAARNGVVVNNFQALDFKLLEPILAVSAEARSVFFPKGKLIEAGEVLHLPQQADFLDNLWREGSRLFYEGEVASKLVLDYTESGGSLGFEDLRNYQSIWRQPLQQNYRNYQLFTNPLPSLGGLRIGWFLESLTKEEEFQKPGGHAHLESIRNAYQFIDQKVNPTATGIHGSTTHFSIMDKSGNSVSLTASNGEGCGYFIEGTDIQLNNMLGEAALLPAGFHSWKPNTRLSSMMAPTMVYDSNKNRMKLITGSSGAGRIPYAISQVIHYYLDFGMSISEAVNSSRVHFQEDCWNLEPGFSFNSQEIYGDSVSKVWAEQSLYFGGVNSIGLDGNQPCAGVDDRREGGGIEFLNNFKI